LGHIAWFIGIGPIRAEERLDAGLDEVTTEIISSGRTVHHATLGVRIYGAWLLMEILKGLQKAYPELHPSLPLWTWVPERPSAADLRAKGASSKDKDVSAVPDRLVRQWLLAYAKASEWDRWTPDEWPLGRHYRALKKLLLLALLATVCPRPDALRRLDVTDFELIHIFEDGSMGPGLCFRSEALKGLKSEAEEYWKKLPDSLGAIIHAWIVCSGRTIGQAGEPLLITNLPKRQGDPGKRYAPSGMQTLINGTKVIRPLVPFGAMRAGQGYAAGRYRHFVVDNVEQLVWKLKVTNPAHPLAHVALEVFGEALLGHANRDMTYRDLRTKRKREQITALGINLGWWSLWDDSVVANGRDAESAVEYCREVDRALTAEIARLVRRDERLRGRLERLDVARADITRRQCDRLGLTIRQRQAELLKLKDKSAALRERLVYLKNAVSFAPAGISLEDPNAPTLLEPLVVSLDRFREQRRRKFHEIDPYHQGYTAAEDANDETAADAR
jgi:hypothetical protein